MKGVTLPTMINDIKRILIVGANSYIGNSFIDYMKQLENKTCQNNWIIDKVSASNGQWKNKDFSNYDCILHTAAIVHKKETKKNESLYYKINRDMAIEVAKKAKKSGVRQFVFLSTMAVYGDSIKRITNKTKPDPISYYGKSKFEAENVIMKLAEDTFTISIIRPPMVYGPDCKGNFSRLVKLVKHAPIFPDVANKRSMIYIENLCDFLRIVLIKNKSGYYHPQNKEYVCTSKMVKVISDNTKEKLYLTKGFNILINILSNRIESISKMFGDCYYDNDIICNNFENESELSQYQVVGFDESVLRSLGENYK